MDVDKNDFDAISKALDEWEKEGKLTAHQTKDLKNNLSLKKTERQQIAQYFFIVAISCAVLAFGAIFIDEKFLEKLKVYYALSNLFIAAISCVLTVLWFWYVTKIRNRISYAAHEVYMVLGVLLLLISLVYFFKDIGAGIHYTKFLFTATLVIFCISLLTKSRILWLAGISSLLSWYCAFTTWLNKDYLFLGMNYPMRIALLGIVIYAVSHLQSRIKALEFSKRVTYLSGLLIFFTGMWAVSIFGNYAHIDEWAKVRQAQVLIYALVFGVFSILAFYYGIKRKDEITRDIGILFLLLNLYTRYFEYFWDNTNKGLFFLVLAISFFLVGRWLDKRRNPKPILKT